MAVQESINTRKGVERCVRFAFDLTRKRNRGNKLTLCGKTNVLTYAFNLWERTFYEVAKEYPGIKTDYAHVDATAMWMVKNPEWFDVIVTDNMFGDIITDLGAMIQGGMGIACGGNINPHGVSMFEPIGGSAPKYTGKNVINPLAAIFAGAMMLDSLGETGAAEAMESGRGARPEKRRQIGRCGQDGHGDEGGGRPYSPLSVRRLVFYRPFFHLLELLAEGIAVYAEQPGGLGDIVGRDLHRGGDEDPLHHRLHALKYIVIIVHLRYEQFLNDAFELSLDLFVEPVDVCRACSLFFHEASG